jgi:hypothetical protein
MATQINIRVDDQTAGALDELAIRQGITRAEVVRDAVVRRLAEVKAERIDTAYARAYAEHPETPDELRQAERTAARITGDEPWEPWW